MKFHKHGALLRHGSGNLQMQTNRVTQDQLPLGWGVAFAENFGFGSMILVARLHLVRFLHPLRFVPKKCAPAMRCARQCLLPFLGAILQLHHFQAQFPSSWPPNILQNCLKGHSPLSISGHIFCLGIALYPTRSKSPPKPSNITPQNLKRLTSSPECIKSAKTRAQKKGGNDC